MVAILAASVPDAFAPQTRHRCCPVSGSDTATCQNDFVDVYCIIAASPSITFAPVDLRGAVFKQVTVVCGDDDDAAGRPGFIEDRKYQPQVF